MPDRLKVAYLGNSRSPHNLRWTRYLAGFFDLVVYTFENEQVPGVPTVVLPRPTGSKADYLLQRRHVAERIAEQKPDLMHAHRISSYGFVGAYAARYLHRRGIADVPFLLSVWGEDVFSFPRKSLLHRLLTQRVLIRASQILSTSTTMARETERYVRPVRPILVTPFGVDTQLFRAPGAGDAPAGEAADAGAGAVDGRTVLPGQTVTVGTVKKLRKRYGVDVLIRAFAAARARLAAVQPAPGGPATAERTVAHDLRLRIVGDGPERARLEALAAGLGVAESIEFAGRVAHERVPATLAGLDIFAALSVTDDESFGVAMLEASAMGLPVLATRVGGIPEVVEHGETGYLVAPYDAEGAAARLVEMAQDALLRERMGAAGRKLVEERYSWNATAERMREIYLEAAAR